MFGRKSASTSALDRKWIDQKNFFQGSSPAKNSTKPTDLQRDLIPRAIYNDPIEELLLRVEGFSGRRISPQDPSLKGLKNPTMDFSAGKPLTSRRTSLQSTSREVNIDCDDKQSTDILPPIPQDSRTVILTELGIDIINLAVADPILPIKKPNFPSPGDHPVHFPARHKALPPTFPRPVRYATWKNILGVSSAQAIKAAKETCQGMRDRDIQLLKQQVLRYKRKTDVLKLSHFRPGLSFRGRGELEKAKEWKVIESVTSTDEQILPVLSVIPQTSSATKPEKSLGSLVIITGQSVTRSLESTLIGAVGESTIKSLDNHSPDRSKMAVTNMEKETPLGTVFSLSPASSSEMRVSESAGASQKDPKSVSMTEHLVSTASPNVSSQPTMNLSNCSSLVSPSMEIPLLPADKAESEPALANGKMHSSPLKETDSPIESLNSACTSQGSVDAQWIEEQKKELFGERRIDESSVPSLFEKKTRRKSSRKTSFTSDPLQKPIPRHFHTSARIERDESDLFANELLHSMLKSASEETRPQEAVAVPLVKTRTSLQDSSAPVSLRNSNSNTRVGHSEKADAAVESLEAPDVSSSLIKSADLSPGPLPGETVNSESLVFSYEGAIAQILANENIETHSRCYSELGPSSCEDLELSHSRSRSMQSISNLSASSKKDKKKGSSLIVKSFSKSIEKLNYVIEKRKRNSDGLSTNRASFEQLLHDAQSISVSRPSITKTESFMEIMSSKSREVTEHQTISSSSLQPIQLEDTPYALAIDEALKSMSEEPREEPYSIIDSHNANNLSGNNPEEKTSEDDLMEYLHRNRSGPIDPSADLIPHELTTNDIIESETVMVKDQSQKNPLETLVESTNIPEAPLFLSTLDKQRIMTPLVVDISSPELIYNQTETSNVGTDFHPVTDAAASDTVQTLTQVSYPAPADPTQDTKVSLIAPRTHIISPEFILGSSTKATLKDVKCEVRIVDFELYCNEQGKNKTLKEYFPVSLRQIVGIDIHGDNVELRACVGRKGNKEGSKLKSLPFTFSGKNAASWAEAMRTMVFGLDYSDWSTMSILVLIDKVDSKGGQKHFENLIKPVFEAACRPFHVKFVQFNEFSIANALSALDFKTISNVVCVNNDFSDSLLQILVRNQYHTSPDILTLESDPVDAAVSVLRSIIGKSKQACLQVSSLLIKREESKLGGIFKVFK